MFATKYEAAGVRISSSKSEAMILSRKGVNCPLQVKGKSPPQAEEFKCLRVLFTSEGKMAQETDRWIGAVLTVMQMLKSAGRYGEERAEPEGKFFFSLWQRHQTALT